MNITCHVVLRDVVALSTGSTRTISRYYTLAWQWVVARIAHRRCDCGLLPTSLPPTGGHPFYHRLNQVLDAHAFDTFVEAQCASYATMIGRQSLTPGTYFRLLLIGYFEGIDSERGIAWRPPEHSTISRTRRLIDLETHRAVFTWILQVLATADLVKGKTIGIDATTLEANAALRSIVRRDSGETYQEFLTRLAQASGIETPTRADLHGSIASGRKKAAIPSARSCKCRHQHRLLPVGRNRWRGRRWDRSRSIVSASGLGELVFGDPQRIEA